MSAETDPLRGIMLETNTVEREIPQESFMSHFFQREGVFGVYG